MRNLLVIGAPVAALLVAGCASGGGLSGRDRPDEFATARRAPLVVPPDFALVPPTPGQPRPQEASPADQALDAMFGGPAPRSAGEQAVLSQSGTGVAQPGIRSAVGDPATNVVNKGSVTQDILAAPEGDGQQARAAVPQ